MPPHFLAFRQAAWDTPSSVGFSSHHPPREARGRGQGGWRKVRGLQRCGTPRVGYYRGWWGGRVLGRVHNPLNPRVSQCTKSRKTRKTQNTPSNRTLNPDATRRGRYPSTRKARGLLFRRHSWRRARSPSCKTQGHQPHCGRLAAFGQPPVSRPGTLVSMSKKPNHTCASCTLTGQARERGCSRKARSLLPGGFLCRSISARPE